MRQRKQAFRTAGQIVAYGLAGMLALTSAACIGGLGTRSTCEDCAARTTRSLPGRLIVTPDSAHAVCPRLVSDSAGAQLAMVRVLPNGRADYEVAGRYGAHDDELLRLHCSDGSVAGLVRR